jgi:hypothetical protein
MGEELHRHPFKNQDPSYIHLNNNTLHVSEDLDTAGSHSSQDILGTMLDHRELFELRRLTISHSIPKRKWCGRRTKQFLSSSEKVARIGAVRCELHVACAEQEVETT